MKPTLLLLPLLFTATAFCAEEANLVDLLPPGTQIVFGIHVRTVVDSELAHNLTAELKGQAADYQKLIATSGFDPLHDLDEVLVASTGAGKNAPTLIVARGTFDVAKLAPNAEQYNGVPVMASNAVQAHQGMIGFLDASTALAGDADMVKAAIDRRGSPIPLESTLGAKVNEYRDRYDLWAVVNRTDSLQGLLPPSNNNPQAAALNSIDRLQFGVSLKQGLKLAAEAHSRSPKDAEQLASTLQFFGAMAKASQPAGAQGAQFDIKSEGGTIKVSLSVSEEELKKAIENQRKAGFAFNAQPNRTHPARVVTAPVLPVSPDGPAPVAVQPSPKPVAPGVGPDTDSTAVFSLPGQP